MRVLATIVVVVLLTACGGGGGQAGDTSTAGTTAQTLVPPPSTTEPSVESTTSSEPNTETSVTTQPAPDTTLESSEQVTPVISFENRTLTFVRQLRVPLWASVEPEAALSYRLIEGHPDSVGQENCAIDGTDLLFLTEPDPPPAPARCAVEASSEGAEPVVAVIEIGFANWVVSIEPIGTVSHADTGGAIEVTVFEDSGSAYGVSYEWFCGDGGFESGFATPDPSPPGTTEYRLPVTFGPDAGTCNITVQAEPLDHAGGGGRLETAFEVVP